MNKLAALVFLGWMVLLTAPAAGDAGVLIPSSERRTPDPAILSLEEMNVRIVVDHRLMKVSLTQYYASHVPKILEGTYLFSFPREATLSDFAIWDGVTRIPGVIMEKRKAAEIYEELARQAIDPGLLQMGETGDASEIPSSFFTVKVAPISGFGFKRVELEYQQHLPVEGGRVSMYLPLKSTLFDPISAGRLTLDLDIRDGREIRNFKLAGSAYPVQWKLPSATRLEGRFEGTKVTLAEDFGLSWEVTAARSAPLLLAWRAREADLGAGRPLTAEDKPPEPKWEDGYFLLDHILPEAAAGQRRQPVTLVLAVDTSLSMWWNKLQQVDTALRAITGKLEPADAFNLILFNERAKPVFPAPQPATEANLAAAMDAFYKGVLSGGTNLVPAITEGVKQLETASGLRYLVLVGDCLPTVGEVKNAGVLSKLKPLLHGKPIRVMGVLTGDDGNAPLLETLAEWSNGQVLPLGVREEVDAEVDLFAANIGREPYSGLTLATPPSACYQVYPAHPVNIFAAYSSAWVGRYRPSSAGQEMIIRGRSPEMTLYEERVTVALPEEDRSHPLVPRVWARARVDFLLDQINREGEDPASIKEIISLSRKYKFITPYTSFLAAPRSLLRPRVIQPKDPVLRLKTDPEIISVSVRLPWGESLPLRFIPSLGLWQTRFFVPPDLTDGTHRCLVVMRDRQGRLLREEKTFLVDSQAPAVRWLNPVAEFRPGESVVLKVDAPADTRSLTASLPGAGRVRLRWDDLRKCCLGTLSVPAKAPPGPRQLCLVAEDTAHNVYRADFQVRVLP